MEKSILDMVGGKSISPHYDIKAESTSCHSVSKGFTGIEINRVRFSNIGEIIRYMDKQRTQLIEAIELIKNLSSSLSVVGECGEEECELLNQAEQFISEVEK